MLEALRLDEHLMALLVGEANDLVLDGRAVARSRRLDLARVHRCAVQVGADHPVRELAGVGEVAEHLRELEPVGENGEWPRRRIAGRFLQPREIDAVAAYARWRSGLEAAELEA